MKEGGGADLRNVQIEFQVTEQPLYLLVTQTSDCNSILKGNETWSRGSITGYLLQPFPAVLPELLMSVTFAKMHKALISAQLTFTSWNPPVEPNHNRGMLWNENTQTYIL